MAPDRLEKLKILIQTSPILTPEERTEWLALLDLMNDKQLLELENILVAGSKQKSTVGAQTIQQVIEKAKQSAAAPSAVPNLSPTLSGTPSASVVAASGFSGQNSNALNKPQSFPVSGLPNNGLSAGMQMPNLSHIVNLPNLGYPVYGTKPAPPQPPKPPVLSVKNPVASAKPETEKKRNSFAEKLKSIFSEKELPAGSQSSELELPKGDFFAESKKLASVAKPLAEPPATGALKSFAHEAVKSARAGGSVSAPPPISLFPNNIAQPMPSPDSQPKSPLATGQNFPPLGGEKLMPRVSPIKTGVAAPLPAQSGIVRPVISAEESNKLKKDILASIQKHQQEGAVAHVENFSASSKPTPVPQSLSDLASLSGLAFETENLSPITLGIKKLINKFSYHDAIFNIEKSPVYKSYIQTGLQLLTQQTDFENLSSGQAGQAYLSRRQFENMTDLLREIQAG